MDSPYNAKSDEEDLATNSFGFSEGYLIPSSGEQDNLMRETFTNIGNNEEYDLLGNNCATTVQRTMESAGLKTYDNQRKIYRVPANHSLGESSFTITHESLRPIVPSASFKSIVKHNPQGSIIYKTRR